MRKRNLSKFHRRLFFILSLGAFAMTAFQTQAQIFNETRREGNVAHLAQPSDGIHWESDINRALQTSRETGKLIYIHFYGNHCPPCKSMEQTVFTDPRVVMEMNEQFVAVKADMAHNIPLAKQLKIEMVPTDIVIDADSRLVDRREGGISPDRFFQYLKYLQNKTRKTLVSPPQGIPTATIPSAGPASNPPSPVAVSAERIATPNIVEHFSAPAAPVDTPLTESQDSLHDPFTRQPVAGAPALADHARASTQTPNPPMVVSPPPAFGSPMTLEPGRADHFSETSTLAATERENGEDTKSQTVEIPLGLEGYCPVVLGNEERWVAGNPAYYAMYRGQIYRFSSEQAMEEFLQSPAKFAPVSMGEDIVLMVDRNKRAFGKRKFGAWYEGRVFLFTCRETFDAFNARPEYYAEIAEKYETAFKPSLNTVQR